MFLSEINNGLFLFIIRLNFIYGNYVKMVVSENCLTECCVVSPTEK